MPENNQRTSSNETLSIRKEKAAGMVGQEIKDLQQERNKLKQKEKELKKTAKSYRKEANELRSIENKRRKAFEKTLDNPEKLQTEIEKQKAIADHNSNADKNSPEFRVGLRAFESSKRLEKKLENFGSLSFVDRAKTNIGKASAAISEGMNQAATNISDAAISAPKAIKDIPDNIRKFYAEKQKAKRENKLAEIDHKIGKLNKKVKDLILDPKSQGEIQFLNDQIGKLEEKKQQIDNKEAQKASKKLYKERASHTQTKPKEEISQQVQRKFEAFERKVDNVVQRLSNAATQAASTVKENATKAASRVKEGASSAAGNVSNAATQAASTVKENATKAATAAKEGLSSAAGNVSNATTQAASTVKENATKAATTVKEGLSSAAGNVSNAATQAASTVKENATKAATTVKEGLTSLANKVETIATRNPERESFSETDKEQNESKWVKGVVQKQPSKVEEFEDRLAQTTSEIARNGPPEVIANYSEHKSLDNNSNEERSKSSEKEVKADEQKPNSLVGKLLQGLKSNISTTLQGLKPSNLVNYASHRAAKNVEEKGQIIGRFKTFSDRVGVVGKTMLAAICCIPGPIGGLASIVTGARMAYKAIASKDDQGKLTNPLRTTLAVIAGAVIGGLLGFHGAGALVGVAYAASEIKELGYKSGKYAEKVQAQKMLESKGEGKLKVREREKEVGHNKTQEIESPSHTPGHVSVMQNDKGGRE